MFRQALGELPPLIPGREISDDHHRQPRNGGSAPALALLQRSRFFPTAVSSTESLFSDGSIVGKKWEKAARLLSQRMVGRLELDSSRWMTLAGTGCDIRLDELCSRLSDE